MNAKRALFLDPQQNYCTVDSKINYHLKSKRFQNVEVRSIFLTIFLDLPIEPFVICSNFGQCLPIKFRLENTKLLSFRFLFRICTVARTSATYIYPLSTHTCTHKWTRASIWAPFLDDESLIAITIIFIFYVIQM